MSWSSNPQGWPLCQHSEYPGQNTYRTGCTMLKAHKPCGHPKFWIDSNPFSCNRALTWNLYTRLLNTVRTVTAMSFSNARNNALISASMIGRDLSALSCRMSTWSCLYLPSFNASSNATGPNLIIGSNKIIAAILTVDFTGELQVVV